jgi:hypothetical protein
MTKIHRAILHKESLTSIDELSAVIVGHFDRGNVVPSLLVPETTARAANLSRLTVLEVNHVRGLHVHGSMTNRTRLVWAKL